MPVKNCVGKLRMLIQPFCLQVKVHLQSKSNASIAVGHQHTHEGTIHALRSIYKQGGVNGMWRGAGGSVPRLAVGSASQLGGYYVCKEFLEESQVIKFL